ncbi:hypothetical protein HPB50_021990 [Hyalomma asiaticum]|uniref:Uncharacterized protein n=1 Tax=Hyalomma asiaticum TaxID=266040 RepID=A0ACB7S7X2_HYAAI|nr:hypothetical protein HPB50_021990 [Hyalomma asiaticum]
MGAWRTITGYWRTPAERDDALSLGCLQASDPSYTVHRSSYHDGVPAATTTFSFENTADCTPADDSYSSFTSPQASDPSSISVAAASLLEAEGMSHPEQLQAQSSSLSVLRNKEAVAAVVLDTMHDAEATTYPQPSENCSISSASLWHGDVETMLELDVLPHKGHDLHTYARMRILPGPLGLPPGIPVLSASGATDKASMLRQALANAKEDTAKMTVPTITRDQSTKAHPPAYATPSDLLSPELSGSDEGSISSTCALLERSDMSPIQGLAESTGCTEYRHEDSPPC